MSQEAPVALVTGSRKGLGRYLAERLVASGYRVVGCSRQPAEWTLDGYSHVVADVADEAQVKALFATLQRTHGRLDVAINNAGVASMNHALLVPAETVDRVMATNVKGTFLVSREAAKLMRKRRHGRIVNLTTVAVPLALEGEAVYVASKGAVEALTRVLGRELAELGITVNAVGPTPIDTDLIKGVPAERLQALAGRMAVRRPGQPEDVFNVVRFLIDERSGMVTGQVIYLGGVG